MTEVGDGAGCRTSGFFEVHLIHESTTLDVPHGETVCSHAERHRLGAEDVRRDAVEGDAEREDHLTVVDVPNFDVSVLR